MFLLYLFIFWKHPWLKVYEFYALSYFSSLKNGCAETIMPLARSNMQILPILQPTKSNVFRLLWIKSEVIQIWVEFRTSKNAELNRFLNTHFEIYFKCTYIENVDGRKAVLDTNIPALNTRNAKVKRPTWTPNSRHILLEWA